MCKPNQQPTITPLDASTVHGGNEGTFITEAAVPTFRHESTPARQLDVSSLSSSQLEELRAADPFMYYSIPMDGMGSSREEEDTVESSSTPSRRSMVTRRSVVSVERHSIPSMEEMAALMLELQQSPTAAAASSLNQDEDMSFDPDFDYFSLLESSTKTSGAN